MSRATRNNGPLNDLKVNILMLHRTVDTLSYRMMQELFFWLRFEAGISAEKDIFYFCSETDSEHSGRISKIRDATFGRGNYDVIRPNRGIFGRGRPRLHREWPREYRKHLLFNTELTKHGTKEETLRRPGPRTLSSKRDRKHHLLKKATRKALMMETSVPDTDSDSDSDSEVSNFEDDDLFGDVKSDTDFLIFSSALRVGHENALAREKEKHRKRKAHYTGNSDRSLRRHRGIWAEKCSKRDSNPLQTSSNLRERQLRIRIHHLHL